MSAPSLAVSAPAPTAASGRPGRWPMPPWGYRHCAGIFLGTWLFGALSMWAGVRTGLAPAAEPMVWPLHGDYGFMPASGPVRMWLRDVLRAAGFIALLVALVATRRASWRELGIRSLRHRVRAGFAIGLFVAVQGLRVLARLRHPLPVTDSLQVVGIDSPMDWYFAVTNWSWGGFPLAAASAALLPPLLHVAIAASRHSGLLLVLGTGAVALPLLYAGFFQGLLYSRLRADLGPIASTLLTTVGFVAVQSIDVFIALPLFVMAIFAAWLVETSRSLWPALVVLGLGNVTVVVVRLLS